MRKSPAPEFVNDLLNAARNTSGQVAVEHELELLSKMASEVLRLMRMREEVDVRIERAGVEIRSVGAMRCCLGAVTAAIIYAYLGDPTEYQSAAAFEKAAGLNLVERSSGTDAGTKHISKRGPGIVRKYLFLAAMRLTQTSPIAKAWYQSRKSFGADQKAKALIALERKLCRALFHVAADKPFDATKLFDTRRLDVAAVSCTEAA
jgi:transposase